MTDLILAVTLAARRGVDAVRSDHLDVLIHAPLLELVDGLLGPKWRAAIIEGLSISDAAFNAACARMDRARQTLFKQLHDADAVLWPAAPASAPEGLAWTGDPSFISPWITLGGPSVTVRVGTGNKDLPIGMLLTARPGSDREFAQAAVCLADALEDPAVR